MPKLLQRQQPKEGVSSDERQEVFLDGLLVNGHDALAAHRAHIRAMNAARRAAEVAALRADARRAASPINAWARLAAAVEQQARKDGVV